MTAVGMTAQTALGYFGLQWLYARLATPRIWGALAMRETTRWRCGLSATGGVPGTSALWEATQALEVCKAMPPLARRSPPSCRARSLPAPFACSCRLLRLR